MLGRTWLMAALIASLALAPAACGRDDSPDVKQNVENAFERERVQGVDTEWDDDGRVLHLKGSVASEAERARAEEIATRAVGTSGRVANELTLRGANERTADNMDGTIEDQVENLIRNDQSLRGRDVEVSVNNGVVTLTGQVNSETDRQRIGEQVGRLQGVREVVNSLRVGAAR